MLYELPNNDVLYEALISRSNAYEGLAYVGVTSTGVFCRLTCPARKPKRENSVFFDRIAGCMEAGFRPCKRCQPLISASEADPVVQTLVAALERDPSPRANGANQISVVIPCHRVIGSDGSLTGYGGGRWRKKWLIDHERKMRKSSPETLQRDRP